MSSVKAATSAFSLLLIAAGSFYCHELLCANRDGHWVTCDSVTAAPYRTRRTELKVTLDQPNVKPGNLLYVDSHPVASLQEVVYLSGNKPYQNNPPNVSLSRRTMLDLLFDQRFDAVDLVYMHRIGALLTSPGPLLNQIITEASEAETSEGYKGQLQILQGYLLNPVENASELQEFCTTHSERYRDLLSRYDTSLTAYRALQTQRFGPTGMGIDDWNENSSTHTEIMFLHDILTSRVETPGTILEILRSTPIVNDPSNIYSTSPMCKVCEPAVVGSCIGQVMVVSEREPTAEEYGRNYEASNVTKVHVSTD